MKQPMSVIVVLVGMLVGEELLFVPVELALVAQLMEIAVQGRIVVVTYVWMSKQISIIAGPALMPVMHFFVRLV